MRIVFMGTPDFAVGTLASLIENGHTVSAVVTQPDKPKGRGMEAAFSPVKAYAVSRGIPVLQPEKIRGNTAFFEALCALDADVFVVVAYGKILPKEVLALPRLGCVNVHASLLPKYRGSAPIQRCIEAGDTESGVTTMLMDEGMDTGDILDVAVCPISPDMTGGELHDALASLGAKLINVTLEKLNNGTAVRTKQNEDNATYVKMLSKEEGKLNFSASAEELSHRIRAFDPWPTAYCTLKGQTFKLFAPAVTGKTDAPCGTLLAANSEGVSFACGDGKVLTARVIQAAGSRRMEVSAYLNGHKLPVGEVCEP